MPRRKGKTAIGKTGGLSAMPLPGMETYVSLPQTGPALAGIDEAGRGCLAGPVVAAAVILPKDFSLEGLTDSKKLTEMERERFAPMIREQALAWGLGVVWPRRIDAINILQATFEAMGMAAASLDARGTGQIRDTLLPPEELLIDGNKTIPVQVLARSLGAASARLWQKGAPLPRQKHVVKGDSLVLAISAASVLAKTWRDRLMVHLDSRYPGYGFAEHKGYGTRDHYNALALLGPSPQHRLTYRGVAADAAHSASQASGTLIAESAETLPLGPAEEGARF